MDAILNIVAILILLSALARLIIWLGDRVTSHDLAQEQRFREHHKAWNKILNEVFTPEEVEQFHQQNREEPPDGTA